MKPLAILLLLLSISAFGQKTDLANYLPPSPPSLPAAGSTLPDSSFETTVLRITDSSTDAGYCWHDYAYFEAMNLDNSLIQVQCVSGRYWFTFNSTTLALGAKHAFPLNPSGNGISGDSVAQFSGLIPNKMFVLGSTDLKLWSVADITTGPVWTTENTFSSGLPAGTDNLGTIRKDRNDEVFAILTRNGGTTTGCIAYRNSTKTILFSQTITTPTSHGCGIDDTGRWFSVNYDSDPGDGKYNHIIDLQNGNLDVGLTADTPDYGPVGHNDYARNFAVYMNGLFPSPFGAKLYKSMTNLHSYTVLTGGTNSDGHVSCRNDDGETGTSEFYRPTGDGTLPWRDEISSYYLDGSNRFIRYVHHFSIPDLAGTDPYRSQPQAVISRDGQFIIFNSNWGNPAGRIDVFLVKAARRSVTPAGSGVSGF